MTTISARTILQSSNASAPNKILSTLLLRYPRFIHAEFLTHRALTKNSGSSRAIPVKKMIDDILVDTAMPIHWGKAQPGMQAFEQCWNEVDCYGTTHPFKVPREQAWLVARDNAITVAKAFDEAGYAKQVVNRLLEPFMHITVLVSSTEWQNFLDLRDHRDAEPHIQMLAREIRQCLDHDPVQVLHPGQWHLPFVTDEERDNIDLTDLIKLSVARCASTSYKTVDGFDMTPERAVALHDKLVSSRPIHASPAEHAAQADYQQKRFGTRGWEHPQEHGNFVGFRQYRKQLELAA